jgi:P27 family predicted phage terminase small subunit
VTDLPMRANSLRIHSKPVAPDHLRPATREWFDSVTADFALEHHHLRLLTLACEAWDRGTQAREELSETGLTYLARDGCPHAHPSVAIERDSRLAFARILRELDLDSAVPTAPSRPPALRSLRR